MKTQRMNKRKRVNSKTVKTVEVVKDYPDTLAGQTVVLKSLPTNVKRAKRLFKVDKKYKIQKPEKKRINTLMSVYLKGKDEKLYQIQFQHWSLLAN